MTSLFALLLVACSPILDIHGGPVGHLDSATRTTFSVDDPRGSERAGATVRRADEVRRRAGLMAATILRTKGYQFRKDAPADLGVQIYVGRCDETVDRILPIPLPSGRQAGRVEASEREDIAEGALIVDVVDLVSRELIWHGAARVLIDPEAIDDALLRRAVAGILERFPDRGATP